MATLPFIAAIDAGIHQEMRRDPSVLYFGQNMATTENHDFVKAYGHDRVRVTPISETAEIGIAIGAAMAGLRPVVELYMAEFMLVAMDQVVNEAPRFRYMSGGQVKVPLVLKAGFGFACGWAGQHTGSLTALFMGVPGLKVVVPSTAADAKGLMATAIRDDNPVVFLHHYLLTLEPGEVPDGEHLVPFGKAEIRRAGGDVTIVATGWMVPRSLAAAEKLAKEGIQAEVIDPRTVAPLDLETILKSVAKTGRLVLVDQAPRHATVAGIIAGRCRRAWLLLVEGADRAGHGARRDRALQRTARGVRDSRRGADHALPSARCCRDGADRPGELLQAPVAALEDCDQAREKLRGETAVGHAMIDRQREIRHRTHDHGSVSRHHTIALSADGEYRGLRRIDDGREAVRPFRTEIRDAERGALDFLALQSALEAALHAILAAARNLREAEAFDIMNHRHQQAIVDRHHQTNMRAARRHDAGVGRVRVARERGVQTPGSRSAPGQRPAGENPSAIAWRNHPAVWRRTRGATPAARSTRPNARR